MTPIGRLIWIYIKPIINIMSSKVSRALPRHLGELELLGGSRPLD